MDWEIHHAEPKMTDEFSGILFGLNEQRPDVLMQGKIELYKKSIPYFLSRSC